MLVKIKISVDTSVKRDDTEPVNYKETTMRVYVLTAGYDYESDWVEGVYSDRESAEAEGKRIEESTTKHYDITECEVE